MDVIDHAIETGDTSGGLEATVESNPAGEGESLDGGSDVADGHDTDAAGPTEGDDQGGESDEGESEHADEGGEGTVRDPATGKFVKKDEQPKPGEKPSDPNAAKKPADPVNDPIPKDLKKETQDRMRSLISTTKEVTAQRDAVAKDFDYMIEGIKATGTTPEQYGELLSFMALFNSNDPASQTKALELVESVADRLAMLLGKERTVSDPMREHEDLRAAVQAGKITPQYAQEIARTRNQSKFTGELTAADRARTAQEQAAKQEKETARNDLNALEAELSKNDPQYAAKKAQLVPILKPIFANIPPSQWKARFAEAYANVQIARRSTVPARQPMRGGGSSGPTGGKGGSGMTSGAGSMLDAVNEALNSMGK
jgi:hypothetical protein